MKPESRRDDSTLPTDPKVPARQTRTDLTSPSDPQQADLPHERDESVGMTGGVPSEAMKQGQIDIERGLKDTSRANETDIAYRKLKRPD